MQARLLRFYVLLTTAGTLLCISATGKSLEPLLTNQELWSQSAETIMNEQREWRLNWTQPGRLARSTHDRMQIFDLRILEMTLAFEESGLSEAILYLHSRGDAGVMAADKFRELLQKCAEGLDDWAGQTGGPPAQQRGPSNMTLSRRIWSKPPIVVSLEYSVSSSSGGDRFQGEFARMRIRKEEGVRADSAWLQAHITTRPPVINAMTLRERVERRENGDVFIRDVPMVDQGQRGYCVAAVSERVLLYYGRDFDQHQFAQLAGTTSAGGTSADEMVRALRRVGSNMTLNFRSLHDFTDYNSFTRLIRDYNRAASRADKQELPISRNINAALIFQMMEPDILLESRHARSTDYQRFLDHIRNYTQRGIPLIWGVYLGLYTEDPPMRIQATGGHLRLIIGYNDTTGQIIFSDTWGSGHEEKRIGQKEAWSMTTGLYALLPRSIR